MIDTTLVLVVVAFAAIVLGVATYKHYKKKARLAALKQEDALSETPEAPKAPSVGGGSSTTTKPPQHAK